MYYPQKNFYSVQEYHDGQYYFFYSFYYLGIIIPNNGLLKIQVQDQTRKAIRLAGCVNDMIWDNKYLRIETKARLY